MKFAEPKSKARLNVFIGLYLFYFLTFVPAPILASQDKHFPVPPFLSDNVVFWKNVYTNVSVDEGLLHDRKYPLIIYQKINVGNRRGRTLEQYVNTYKKRIADILRGLFNKPSESLSDEEIRFINMFKEYSSVKDIPQAIDRIRFQLGQRESFLKGLEQSGMYIDEIFAILKRENLPLRLAYLPHVESAFNIQAVSKAGAVGLWQFMWATGKNYLDIDRFIDERRDPILSTEAAIQLLKKNYNELKSWPLAITAYNYGLAGIKRAVRSTGSTDIATIIQKHKSRSFQFASKNFYSCFLAACEIDENYQRYFKLVRMAPPLLRKRFIIDNPKTPEAICEQLHITLSEFKSLNPAYKPALYKYQAIIPKYYTVFLPLSVSNEELGYTFQHPKSQNDNLNIFSPVLSKEVKPTPKKKQEIAAKKPTVIIKKPRTNKLKKSQLKIHSSIASPKYQKCRVKKGDSIWLIARQFNTDVKTLRKINGLKPKSLIHPGQILRVPIISSKKSSKKETKKASPKKSVSKPLHVVSQTDPLTDTNSDEELSTGSNDKNGSILWKKYRVKAGDTLWDISKEMNTPIEKLKQLNQLRTKQLQPGQILFIPQDTSSISLLQKNQKEDHQIAIERIQKLIKQQNKNFVIDYYYTVKSGDDLKSIAQQTGVPLEYIAIVNHMTEDLRVYEGQVIRIPKKIEN